MIGFLWSNWFETKSKTECEFEYMRNVLREGNSVEAFEHLPMPYCFDDPLTDSSFMPLPPP